MRRLGLTPGALALLLTLLATVAQAQPPRRFALVVGNDEGGVETRPLRYAREDARRMHGLLLRLGGVAPEDARLLLNEDAEDFFRALDRLEARAKAARARGERTAVLVYYSGHAKRDELLLGDTRVSFSALKHRLNASSADVRIAILDACRSGALTRTKGVRRAPAFTIEAGTSREARGTVILTSSAADEDSQESDLLGGSYFSHHLVSGLLVERIREERPTKREPHRRIWGPFPVRELTGHEVRFVMEREGDRFDYRLQYRPKGTGEAGWWSLLEGTFLADAGVRKGEGEVHLFLKSARARGLDTGGLRNFGQLDIGYQTRELPTRVDMLFTPESALLPDARYGYRELPGGFGEMVFVVRGANVVPGLQREDVEATTRWTPGQGGVSTFVVLKGNLQGATYAECWNAEGRITWLKRSWEAAGSGDPASCPDVSVFER